MSVYLQNGELHAGWYDTRATHGEFLRPSASFRDWVTADGSSGYPAESGRYHLYVSLACPWAHRTLIVRALKRLDGAVSVSIVEPVMLEQGWCFSEALPDHVNGFSFLHQLYTTTQPDYSGRISVPVLWDKVRKRIVNNESSEIIRMLNGAFNQFGDASVDLYPHALRAEIDALNDFIYENINNGVYRCGFASTQASYESAFHKLFAALDQIEARLADRRFLLGDAPTEADWRLFTTLVRFDAVYYSHFKCSRNRIEDFPHLSRYLRELYFVPGIAPAVNIDQIKRHYFMSHPHINPTGIVPVGPRLKFCDATDTL